MAGLYFNPLNRNIAVFSTMFFFLLVCNACSNSDDPEEPGNTKNPIEEIVSELEKGGKFKIFIQALKDMELEDASYTVFAIQDDVFNTSQNRNVTIVSTDVIKRHIIKGAYPNLHTASVLYSLENEALQVETAGAIIDGNEKELVYLNNTIINADYQKVGNSIIYSIDKIIPGNTQTPPTANEKDYLEWFAQRMEGRWMVIDTKRYRIETDWDGYKEMVKVTDMERCVPESEMIGKYVEVFNREMIDKEKRIYGDNIVTGGDAISHSAYGRSNAALWGLSFSSYDNIIELYSFINIAGNIHQWGGVGIDRKYGVGAYMKYTSRQHGFLINPPNHYPSQKDSLVFLLQKTGNR